MTKANLNDRMATNQEVKQNERMRKTVKVLQDNIVIVPVDKAGHNLAFVCKNWYAQKLRKELQNEKGAYVDSVETVQDVLNRHKIVNEKFGFDHVKAFPYLYGILKAHKQPVQLRYIAGCSKKGSAILAKTKKDSEQQGEKESEEDFIRRMTRERNVKPKCSLT